MVHYSDVVNAEVICFIILHLIRQELSILEGVCPLFSAEIRNIFQNYGSGPVGIRTRDLLLARQALYRWATGPSNITLYGNICVNICYC